MDERIDGDQNADYCHIAATRLDDPLWPLATCICWVWKREADGATWVLAEHLKFGRASWVGKDWSVPHRTLFDALKSGKLVATGVPRNEEKRREIKPQEWHDLSWQQVGSIDVVTLRGTRTIAFRDVICLASDVKKLWPAFNAAKVSSTIADEKRVQASLATLMRERPHDPIPKDQLRKQYPEVSQRGFNRAYANAAVEANAPAWTKAGARRKFSRDT